MAIVTKDRHFGEGLDSRGEENANTAFFGHLRHVRKKRMQDLLGQDAKLSIDDIERKFEEITLAIQKADEQVYHDNIEFIQQHAIKYRIKVLS